MFEWDRKNAWLCNRIKVQTTIQNQNENDQSTSGILKYIKEDESANNISHYTTQIYEPEQYFLPPLNGKYINCRKLLNSGTGFIATLILVKQRLRCFGVWYCCNDTVSSPLQIHVVLFVMRFDDSTTCIRSLLLIAREFVDFW